MLAALASDIQRYKDNLRDELDGAALYAALAAAEPDPVRKDLFLQLSKAEAEHARALALAGIGVATSLFSGRSPGYSAVRQVLIGAAAAGITYAIGALIGISLS